MTVKKSIVSIGLPVFNGADYIKQAIDSILAQTYTNFELIISDNASTDKTQQICLDYAKRDKRIRYYRNKENIGAAANFNRVFLLSSGKYFKWAAHDDVLGPDFLLKCIEILEANPSVVLCHSKTGRINERGELTGEYDFDSKTNWAKPHNRFGDLILFDNDAWVALFGLMRSDSLRKTQLLGSYESADRNLLAEISLVGEIYSIPETLFFRRDHPKAYTNKGYNSRHEILNWWKPNKVTSKFVFPYWTVFVEYCKSVRHIPLKRSERLLCYIRIAEWLLKEGLRLMLIDLEMNIITYFK
jgi:glycosyltransferase involved in cell wall biosynthesis